MKESVAVGGRTGADAEFVDLDRADVAHFFGGGFGLLAAACELVHEALATRSPLKGAGPEVTLKVALTLAPGATGLSEGLRRFCGAGDDGGPLLAGHGDAQLDARRGRVGGVGEGYGGVLRGARGEGLEPGRSGRCGGRRKAEPRHAIPAATTLACTSWSVASVGNVPAAVIAPS